MIDDDNIALLGVRFLVFLFMVIILYFVISTPLETFFDAIDDADVGEATDEMDEYLPYIRTALNMAFAIAIATPGTWLLFKVFSREPTFERERFRYR